MLRNVLVSWVGQRDLDASVGSLAKGDGPIAEAVAADNYDAIHLICNYEGKLLAVYADWLKKRTSTPISQHVAKLLTPYSYREIYARAVDVLRTIAAPEVRRTYLVSAGSTPMRQIWTLLSKTEYPARLIQFSLERGVEESEVPFDISAEFIPKVLEEVDKDVITLAQGFSDKYAEFSDIICRSPVMSDVIAQARRIAIRTVPVLIEGESGTGKELIARALHRASKRADMPFIPVNCGAIPPELAESEFFGHTKGSFSGANASRKGHFEMAHNGTIFLDEIGELPKGIQVKLLRTLQEGEVTPIGESKQRKINVRVIAATNRTLINEVMAGNFREDLFYRLAVAIIKLPPLRERPGDISLLIEALLEKVNRSAAEQGFGRKQISASARNIMLQHAWPGNVREMLNTLYRAAIWSDDEVIGPEAIKNAILVIPRTQASSDGILNRPIADGVDLNGVLAQVARHYLGRALEHTHKNKSKAAELLGFSNYQTLTNWMKRYGGAS
jgi:transcriptional regulator with PAS, ATPase and Fis domain